MFPPFLSSLSTLIFYMSSQKMSEKLPTWETTREPNLLRNRASGRYYGRFTVSGKQKWFNLNTDVWTVAKLRLADERAKLERRRQTVANIDAGEACVGDLATLYEQRIEDRLDIKPKTKRRLREEVNAILKTWPGLATVPPHRITRQAVIEWRNRMSRDGAGHRSPGAKAISPKNNGSSASLINKCIDAIRRMLDIAVERGQLAGNPLYPRGIKLEKRKCWPLSTGSRAFRIRCTRIARKGRGRRRWERTHSAFRTASARQNPSLSCWTCSRCAREKNRPSNRMNEQFICAK